MVYRECNTVAEVFHEVVDLVKWDRSHIETGEENDKVAYYFRAENKNYAPEGSSSLLSVPATPSLFRDDKCRQNEHVIFNEAIRCYPQEFPAGETTFERLTRMAHFGLPTRLLDVSPRLATASTEADRISIKPQTSGDAGVLCFYVVSKNMSTNFK